MGFSLSWIAIRGLASEVALERLGLEPTGRSTGLGENIGSTALRNGWLLIVADGSEHRMINSDSLGRLSASDVIACSIEEHVMVSSAEYWANGRRVWRAQHDAQDGVRHISTDGELPDDFKQLHSQAEMRQAEEDTAESEVDYFFDLPLLLAKTVTGFKHDERNPEIDHAVFAELRDVASPTKSWWQFWK